VNGIEAHINFAMRDEISVRMLLWGRTIREHFVVDPGRSRRGGRPTE
jgi:hypothetical protein